MIVLKDILTPSEWRTTMLILKLTKTLFGQDDYYLFKKMVMVVGFIHGLGGYVSYQSFINSTVDMIRLLKSPINAFFFKDMSMTETFFGVNKKIICESSLNEVRDMMASKRKEMLKLKKHDNSHSDKIIYI